MFVERFKPNVPKSIRALRDGAQLSEVFGVDSLCVFIRPMHQPAEQCASLKAKSERWRLIDEGQNQTVFVRLIVGRVVPVLCAHSTHSAVANGMHEGSAAANCVVPSAHSMASPTWQWCSVSSPLAAHITAGAKSSTNRSPHRSQR